MLLCKIRGGLFFRINLDFCFLKPFPAPPSVLYHLPDQTKTDIKLNRLKKKCKFLLTDIQYFLGPPALLHTIYARRCQTSCQAGTALRCQCDGGVGGTICQPSLCPLHPLGQGWAQKPASLCPLESLWQQAQTLLRLKVSRRLSTPLTACSKPRRQPKGGGKHKVLSV